VGAGDLRVARSAGPGGGLDVWVGVPLADVYLEFLGGRCRPNTVLAAAYDAAWAVRCAVALVSELPRIGVAVHSGECETSGEQVRGVEPLPAHRGTRSTQAK
jgi:hypothetical protein